ncbi:type II secretion system F family protein [Halarsenatibacter silvermanii]|uniref:Type IV pilus assembly protein PilC n=1 Tax=Halarsenatibacter silvermanii TaxID=321763 RepID=A0A1G9LCX0_9FIRM|nr:type II secretion system F family protein [Halarsenatibacter silvermanii]SDL59375.1 type IV pilus assembly protein PilC [Halarsenatibacter silvermanii]
MSPEYTYRARSSSGDIVDGVVNADSQKEAAHILHEQELFITSLDQKQDTKEGGFSLNMDLSSISPFGKGFKTSDLAHFSRQFSVLVAAGIPLVQSLEIMRQQTEKENVRELLTEVRQSVEAGTSFSEALAEHPNYFPNLFVQLVRVGETGGVLDEVLKELSAYYQRRDVIAKEVRGALYYPASILLVATAVVVIMLTFVVPTITDMLVSLGGDLPITTRIMIGTSSFLSSFWWLILGGLAALFLISRYYFNTVSGRLRRDKVLLKLPVAGSLIRKVQISRFASTLSLMLSSGVNLLNALPAMENVIENQVLKDVLEEARSRVREGSDLSRPLKKSGEFPPIVIQMLQVGEQTGSMEEMLDRLAEYYELEVEKAIEGGISLIEPIIIVMMGIVVGGIVASIILPLFDIYTQF